MKPLYSFSIVVVAFAALILFGSYSNEKPASVSSDQNAEEPSRSQTQIVQAVKTPRAADFAGENVPLHIQDVWEKFDREMQVNTFWQSSTILNIKMANRYFPTMERILAEEGVPDDFKYLACAESSLRNVGSPAGAKGIWQFLSGTGKEYGLTVNSEVDERYHLEKSTRAACKYLKKAHGQFDSWSLAAAAYNQGGPRLKKVMAEQKETDYYSLNLNAETARYVFRILAFKHIISSPNEYGFYVDYEDLYPPLNNYRIVEVSGAVPSWGDFAHEHGTTYRQLKVYNPWLLSSSLTNSARKTYEIKIPN